MATTPDFIGTPKIWVCATTGSSTAPDASSTTNIVQLVGTVAAGGARIERLNVTHAPASSTTANAAGVARVWVKRSSTYYLVKELNMSLVSRSATAKGETEEWVRSDGLPVLILEANDEVHVGSEKADAYHWVAIGGNFT